MPKMHKLFIPQKLGIAFYKFSNGLKCLEVLVRPQSYNKDTLYDL